jgi:hypothetical protein
MQETSLLHFAYLIRVVIYGFTSVIFGFIIAAYGMNYSIFQRFSPLFIPVKI